MSNPATQVATPSAITSSSHAGALQRPATAIQPPTGAMARGTPSHRCGHQVKRLERLYAVTHTSASGASARQSGLSSALAARKSPAASTTDTHACASVSAPVGSSRSLVRGFRASNSRSAIRLNPIATQRAAENATITSPTVRRVTGYRIEAASTPSSANGSAKRVWGSLTKLADPAGSDPPRKREGGVGLLDEAREPGEQRPAAEGLPLTGSGQ